jgi:GntR family transcriptional regulator
MPDPLYRQIADDLRQQIESGKIARGQQLETEADLRKRYQASRNTVRDAIKWLTSLGLVESRAGQGTFVAEMIEPFVTELTADTKLLGGSGVERDRKKRVSVRDPDEPLAVSVEVATDAVAAKLGLPAGSDVICRRETRKLMDSETRKIGEMTWALVLSYYPSTFAEKGATLLIRPRDIEQGTVDYLAEKLGLLESRWTDLITVRAPDAEEVALFKLPADGRVGVFEIFRSAFDQDDRPMRLTVTICPVDRNELTVNFGQQQP